jgi:CubicO group peptidase (beta-lactamase class C family)
MMQPDTCQGRSRRLPLIGALALGALGAYAQSLPAADAPIQRLDGTTLSASEADTFAVKTLAAMHVTGAELALINQGRLVWSLAYGQRRKNPPLPMDLMTNTWAASITKSVFATYVMELVERGEFNLDEPVAEQLEKPLDQYEAYRDSASALVSDPLWPTVTPRMLLSHSSGLSNFAFIEPDKKMHLHFKPGSDFLYSGEGINLVQFLIEQRKHQPLEELMQQAVFAPLDMTRTGLIYRPEFAPDVADRFDVHEQFLSQTKRFPAHAAGSMTTTVLDLAAFAVALVNGKLLKPSTQAEMLHPVLNIRSLHEFPLQANESAGQEAAAVGLGYGVGWGLLTKTRYGPAFFKEGHGDGAQNYIICFVQPRSCMIMLTNSDNGELAFRPLLETLLGDTVTPWEWEGYTPAYIEESRTKP